MALAQQRQPSGVCGKIQILPVLYGDSAAGRKQGSVGQLIEKSERERLGAESGTVGRVDKNGVELALLFAKVGEKVLGFGLVQFGSCDMPISHQRSDVTEAPGVRLVHGEPCPAAVGLEPDLAATSAQVEKGLTAEVGPEHGEEGLFEPGGSDVDSTLSARIEGDRPALEASGYDAQSCMPFREGMIMELAAGAVKDRRRMAALHMAGGPRFG